MLATQRLDRGTSTLGSLRARPAPQHLGDAEVATDENRYVAKPVVLRAGRSGPSGRLDFPAGMARERPPRELGAIKHGERHGSGREDLCQDLEQLLAEALLADGHAGLVSDASTAGPGARREA